MSEKDPPAVEVKEDMNSDQGESDDDVVGVDQSRY